MVDILEEIIGLKDIVRLQTVLYDGPDKVPDVF